MDAFEDVVAELLRADGYWVHQGYKVNLTTEEKRALGNPTMPRPEIDLVAYRPGTGELLSLECKSYFNSGGVHARALLPGHADAKLYKMFVNAHLREIVLQRLVAQLAQSGSVGQILPARLGLIYSHATSFNAAKLQAHFAEHGWELFGPDWLCDRLHRMALGSYDNKVASVVAKLLMSRGAPHGARRWHEIARRLHHHRGSRAHTQFAPRQRQGTADLDCDPHDRSDYRRQQLRGLGARLCRSLALFPHERSMDSPVPHAAPV